MPKWLYPLAFLFVLFLIFTDPDGSGNVAGQFGSFIVSFLGAVGEFLTGLLDGASDGAGAIETPSGGLSGSSDTGATFGNAADSGGLTGSAAAESGSHTHTHTHGG